MKINHIGIVVKNIENELKIWRDIFDLELKDITQVESQKVKVAVLLVGDSEKMEIELIEPTSPHSPVTKFLEKRGQGLHHLSFEVKDIEKTISKLKEKGVRVINEVPKKGAFGKKIAFLHPSSTSGVLVEVTEL